MFVRFAFVIIFVQLVKSLLLCFVQQVMSWLCVCGLSWLLYLFNWLCLGYVCVVCLGYCICSIGYVLVMCVCGLSWLLYLFNWLCLGYVCVVCLGYCICSIGYVLVMCVWFVLVIVFVQLVMSWLCLCVLCWHLLFVFGLHVVWIVFC
jgi:hypothetical protein